MKGNKMEVSIKQLNTAKHIYSILLRCIYFALSLVAKNHHCIIVNSETNTTLNDLASLIYCQSFLFNHLRWQLIADHNEWPNRIQLIRRFLFELVGS